MRYAIQSNANIDVLSELDRERRARIYLEAAGFDIGLAATRDRTLNDAVLDHAYHSGFFNELAEYNESRSPEFMTDQVSIQELAWRLLSTKPEQSATAVTFQELFDKLWIECNPHF